jgi:enoyl-CoA hydratase
VSSYEQIRIEHEGPLTWLVLNRPERANALSAVMLDEISDALAALRSEGGAVLAIRGEGKGFCSGMDLDAVGKAKDDAPVDPVADRERLHRNVQRWLAIWDHPKPVIAAVHGFCMGVATQLCVFADLTIVADDAKIGEPAIPIGGGYLAPVWSTLVGPKRAKELAFVAGNTLDGPTAVEWGWANHSVPADRLIETVTALAARIAQVPPDVLRIKKLSINRAAEAQGFREALSHVAEMDALLHLSPSVVAVKKRVSDFGLKDVIAEYRGPSTKQIVEAARGSSSTTKEKTGHG